VEGRLRDQGQRIGLLLGHGGRLRGNVRRVRFRGNARATLLGCTPKVRHGN